MTLKDQMARDAVVMCNTREFGEEITYYPDGDVTAGVTILAVVDREEMGPMQFGSGVQGWVCTITIPRNDETGRTTWSQDDRADVVLRYGETPTRVRVIKLIRMDEGVMTLECVR